MKKPQKLPHEIVALLLPRLNDEFSAYYLYRAASNWCKNVGFFKAAEYYAKESDDELKHAKGIEDYLVDWNVIPDLPKIDKPDINFDSLADIIQQSYDVEYALYEDYEDTSAKVFKTGDMCTFDFLEKYRTIQRTSVAEYSDMINMLEGVKSEDKFQMLLLEETLFGD